MNFNLFHRWSIKTRVTLFTLVIFVASLWAVASYASRMLRQDMQQLLGEQQSSTATLLAAQFDGSLSLRLAMLQQFAAAITPDKLANAQAIQAFLEERLSLKELFNAGAYVTRVDGTAIASVPLSVNRIGVNYMDRDHVAAALKEGKSQVSQPVIGRVLQAPVFAISAPIRDGQGQVMGAIVGVINLSKPNFLDRIGQNTYGKTGGYLLVAPQYRLVVTATDKRRVMEVLPAPGINPIMDRFIDGYRGSAVLTNPLGQEVLASAHSVPTAGWYVAATLPTAEAFAPIREMQWRMGVATLALTLLAGLLSWWLLRRELSPMLDAIKALARLPEPGRRPQPLMVKRQDELGALIGSFNHLVADLAKRETDLQESETRFRSVMEQIPGVAVQGYALDGTVTFWNAASERLYGYSAAEALGGNLLDLIIPAEMREGVQAAMKQMAETGVPIPAGELSLQTKSGTRVPVYSSHALLTPMDGPSEMFCVDIDLSDVKRAQAQMAELARQLQLSEGRLTSILNETQIHLWVFEGQKYTYFNKQWFDFTGQDESSDPSIERWTSVVHPDDLPKATEVWQRNWETKTEHDNYFRLRRHDGVYRDFYCHALPVFDDQGRFQYFQGFNLDVTERKQMEEQVRQLAFYDPLTGLPNRRLLEDRLAQTMAASKRSGLYGALMFMDLDNFKPLNDAHGHAVGDLLLIEVAARLSAGLREVDTVARFGGDEFVVMLGELATDPAEAREQARLVAEKVRVRLAAPYHLAVVQADHESPTYVDHHCTASIGVLLFLNHVAEQADVLKWADLAMYQAKDAGRNRVCFYEGS